MLTWKECTQAQKREIFEKATEFKVTHQNHVQRLLRATTNAVDPSGSDLFHPELWKPIHWRWFLEHRHEVFKEE